MLRVVLIQVVVMLIAASGAWFFVGAKGGASAIAGGLVCVVPNLVFALYLKSAANKKGVAYTISFLLGELIKLVLTLVLLLLVVKLFANLHWPSLLIGLILTVQTVFFAFWILKNER